VLHGTDLSVRLDDFSEVYLEHGVASEYRSDLTVLRDGETAGAGSITVNHPLTVDNVTFYQASFGQAVQLRIADAAGTLLYEDSLALAPFRSKLNADAPAARLDLPPAGVALSLIAPDENPANAPELDTLKLRSGELYLLLRPLGPQSPLTVPVGATIRQGDTRELAGLQFTFVREKRFALFQVASNPGIPLFFAASFLLVGGLAVTFYFPHRRLRAIISPTPGGGAGSATATLAPMAKRDWSAQRSFETALSPSGKRPWHPRPTAAP
jgi:cytochrome c biogenesis protein